MTERKPGVLIPEDAPPPISIEELMARLPKPLCTEEEAMDAYRHLLRHAMEHGTRTSRDLAGLLLNSYNDSIPRTAFSVSRMRHLDAENRRAVLHYLDWLGGAGGRYPPSDDMDALKDRWVEMGWGDLDRND